MKGGPEPLLPPDIRGNMELPRELVQEALYISDRMTEFHGKRKGKWGQSLGDSKRHRRMGTVSEFCMRWAYGMPPLGRGNYAEFHERHEADVGDDCEVRATDYLDGRLFLHDEDAMEPKLSRNYALIVYKGQGVFRVAGWLPMWKCVTSWHDYEHWENGKRNPKRDCKGVYQGELLFSDCLEIVEGNRVYLLSLGRII